MLNRAMFPYSPMTSFIKYGLGVWASSNIVKSRRELTNDGKKMDVEIQTNGRAALKGCGLLALRVSERNTHVLADSG